jgi:hypothetical protein
MLNVVVLFVIMRPYQKNALSLEETFIVKRIYNKSFFQAKGILFLGAHYHKWHHDIQHNEFD